MILRITPEQLRDACSEVYSPEKFEHAPAQVFIDHAWGTATFLRVSFPEKFTHAAACKLDALRKLLVQRHEPKATVVFCVYLDTIDATEMYQRSVAIEDA